MAESGSTETTSKSKGGRKFQPLAARFWAKVQRGSPDQCWPWMASRNPHGYGHFRVADVILSAHRVAWMLTNGSPPADQPHILHSCHNPPCCNPAHLRPGTHTDNMQDKILAGRDVPCPGELNGSAVLTEQQVVELLSLRGTASHEDLGRRFGVNRATVGLIFRGTNWAYIERPETGPIRKRHNSRMLTHDGVTLDIAEWSRRTGIRYQVIYQRIVRDRMSVARALGMEEKKP